MNVLYSRSLLSGIANTTITGSPVSVDAYQQLAASFSATASNTFTSGNVFVQGSMGDGLWYNIASGLFTSVSLTQYYQQFSGPWVQVQAVIVPGTNPAVTGTFNAFLLAVA